MNMKEYLVLKDLNKITTGQDFPLIYGGGEFIINKDENVDPADDDKDRATRRSFIAMEKLGHTLQYYLMKQNQPFSLKTVCQIAIRLI